MEQSKIKRTVLIASLAVLVLIGSTAAFLTSTDTVDNWFEVGKVDLNIEEKFDEDEKLAAGQIITKQPWVKNTGTVNELFFVEVSVPCMEATFLTSNGQRIIPDNVTPEKASDYLQMNEIYNLLADGTPAKEYISKPVTVNDVTTNWELSFNQNTASSAGWVYLFQTEEQEQKINVSGMQDGVYNTYLLGYSAWVAPNQKTVPVFDKLQLRSIINLDVESDTIGQVQVNAYTIQADALNLTGLEGEGTAKKPYTKEDLEKIYQIIQNKQNAL